MNESIKGKETKQKILDCALELFATKGYAGTSMNDIIYALGISKGSVYWHFKSKEDIFVQVIAESYKQWLNLLDEELSDIVDPIDKLRKYSRLFITTVDLPVWRISPETYWNEFDNRNSIILDTLFAKDDILLLEIFQEAISKGELRYTEPSDAERLTWVYISCLEGMFEKIILSYKNVYPQQSSTGEKTTARKKYEAELEKHMEYALFAIDLFLESVTK
ncbi:MAG: TetR/AcrR family transcriptional regulator [Clostridia bacterium]|nr:TetR/AcrR family transcriptional regulator [Clostridia bacterium]